MSSRRADIALPQRLRDEIKMLLNSVAPAPLRMTHIDLNDANPDLCFQLPWAVFVQSYHCEKRFVWQQGSSPGKLSTSRSLGSKNRSGQLELKPGLPQASPQPSSSLQMTLSPTPYSLAMTTADAASRALGFRDKT